MDNDNSNALPKRAIDLTGQVFGKWTVVCFSGLNKRRSATWLCRCECGRERSVTGTALNCGHSEKCSSCARQSHGMNKCPEYHVWVNLRQRCYNPNAQQFDNYGSRGIIVCQKWRDSFEAFFEDMGCRPSDDHSIHRVDNDGNYEPGNCVWATTEEQARHRRSNRALTFNGETRCLAEWAEQCGLPRDTLHKRLARGWTLERSLTTPVSSLAQQLSSRHVLPPV